MSTISAYDKMAYSQTKLPSLQEMMTVPAYMQEQHDLALADSSKLLSEANLAANLAMEDPNSESAKRYQTYISELQKATDLLNTKGLKGSNIKSTLLSAKGRYNAEILPIINAGMVRAKDQELIQKAGLDSTMLINTDPSQLSIDAYIKRGNQSYIPNMINGTDLTKATSDAVKQFSDQIRTDASTLFKDTNLPFQYLAYIQKGATIDEVQDAMIREGRNVEEVNTMTSMLQGVVDNVLKSHGVYDKFGDNENLINKAWEHASRGLYSAIGKPDTQIVTDQFGKQAALKGIEGKPTEPNESPTIPQNPYNPVFVNESGKKSIDNLQSLKNKVEYHYKLFLDPQKGVNQTPLDAKTARNTGAKPLVELTKAEKMKKSAEYWNKVVNLAKEANVDPYYIADKNGNRRAKSLPTLLKEIDREIEASAGGIRGDEVIIDNNSIDAFIANATAGGKKIIDEKGKDISDKFIVKPSSGNSKEALVKGTRLISLPQLGKIRIENSNGDVGYVNFDQFSNIKKAQEAFSMDYNDILLGDINEDGSIRDYNSNINYINSSLQDQGSKYRIDISKFNLGTQTGQIKALKSVIKGKIEIDRDEYKQRFESMYTQLSDAQKKGMSEREFIDRKFHDLENEMFYNQTARASQLNTASFTNTAVESLLRTQTTTVQNVTK